MKYLLIEVADIEEDYLTISDERFEELAKQHGFVIENHDDFQARFNAEHFSTHTHQLRIIDENKTNLFERASELVIMKNVRINHDELEYLIFDKTKKVYTEKIMTVEQAKGLCTLLKMDKISPIEYYTSYSDYEKVDSLDYPLPF